MPDPPERRVPSPSLAIAGRWCFAFTFFQRLPARRGRPGVRVPALFAHARSQPELYHALVEPPLSFFRDIVDADQGPVSMPLIVAIDPVRGDPSLAPGAHDVDVTLPATLHYDAETRHVVLEPARAGGDRVLPFAFRDALAIFESGHVAYVFSLVPRPGRPLALTEYDVIVLEKLVNPTEGCEYLRRELRWGRPGAPGESLVEFVNDKWLDHYGDIVRGVHDLGQLLTDRRSNRLLLVIAVSGLLSVLKDTLDLVGLGPMGARFTVPLVATVGTLVAVVVGREAWVLVQSRMRRRRALRDGVSDRLEPLDRDPGER